MQHEGSCVEANTLCDKWRMDGPRVKEVGVIADLAELHKDVDDTHEVPSCQCLLGAERENQPECQPYPKVGRIIITELKEEKECGRNGDNKKPE